MIQDEGVEESLTAWRDRDDANQDDATSLTIEVHGDASE